MPLLIHCPGCKKPLKVKEELAGKKVKCPSCGVSVPVKVEAPPEVVEEIVEEMVEEPASPQKVAKAPRRATPSPAPTLEEVEEEEQVTKAPVKKKGKAKKEALEDKPKGSSKWVPCPACGTPDPKRVLYTFWGSAVGPRLFSHVRCLNCGNTYNGKSGRSNLIPAIGFVLVNLFLIFLVLGLIGGILYYRLVYQPDQQKGDLPPKRVQTIVRELVGHPAALLHTPKD